MESESVDEEAVLSAVRWCATPLWCALSCHGDAGVHRALLLVRSLLQRLVAGMQHHGESLKLSPTPTQQYSVP